MQKAYLARVSSDKRVQIPHPVNLNIFRTQRQQDKSKEQKIFQRKLQPKMIKHSTKSSTNGENERVYSIYKQEYQFLDEQKKDRYEFELQEKNEEIVNLLKRIEQKQQYITKLQKQYLQNLKIDPNVNVASQLYLISEAIFEIRDSIPKISNHILPFTCKKPEFSELKSNQPENQQLQNSQYQQSSQCFNTCRRNQFHNYEQEDNQQCCNRFISSNIIINQLYKTQNLSDTSSEQMNEPKQVYPVYESVNFNEKQMASTFYMNSFNQSMKQQQYNSFKNEDTLLENETQRKNYRIFATQKMNISKQINEFVNEQIINYADRASQTIIQQTNSQHLQSQIEASNIRQQKLNTEYDYRQIKQDEVIIESLEQDYQNSNKQFQLVSNVISYHNIEKKQQESQSQSSIQEQLKILEDKQIQTETKHKNMKFNKSLINMSIGKAHAPKKKNPLKINGSVLRIKIDNDLQKKKQSKRKFKSLIKSNLQILTLVWKFTVKHVKTYPKDPAYGSKVKRIEQIQNEMDMFINEYNEGYRIYMNRKEQENLQFENQCIEKIRCFTQFFNTFNKNLG